MKTRISEKNPFRRTFRMDHAFAWEKIRSSGQGNQTPLVVMDYGANDGKMLRACLESGLALEGYGVDANKSAIKRGQDAARGHALRLGDVCEFEAFSKAAGGFETVCLMGVLEHVLDQPALLARLHGSMRSGGLLLLSVPGRHFLSWMDFGNWKFYFPRLHRIFIERFKGRDYYREKFVECRNGLFGDIEVGKGEHQHFTKAEITSLINGSGFEVEFVDGYGLTYRFLHNVWWLTPRPLKGLLEPLIRADLRAGGSAELIMMARRR